MTDDDKILSLLVSNPNEMLSPTPESSSQSIYSTTKRSHPLQRKGGNVYSLSPSELAMKQPLNSNTSGSYYTNEI